MRLPVILVVCVAVAGCQSTHPTQSTAAIGADRPAQYSLVGDVEQTGLRTLQGDETVGGVLRDVGSQADRHQPGTAVLVRRCPEGMSRELIDFDAAYQLVNPSQNYSLRDGDELILPSRRPVPQGLQRPPAARMSMAN